MSLAKGLQSLGFVHTTDFTLEDYADGKGVVITWLSQKPQPTMDEINAASDAFKAEHTSNKYKRDRAEAYASLQDQLDMQYWDAVNGTTLWQDHIAKIKSDIPKE